MTVDMSPEAVTARLRLVSELRDICLALAPRLSTVGTKQNPHQNSAQPQPGCEVAQGQKQTP